MNTRVATLQAVFDEIAQHRMSGLPVCHPGLRVEAIGFAPWHGEGHGDGHTDDHSDGGTDLVEPPCALGVLVTPWFMNLVCLPIVKAERPEAVGQVLPRRLAGQVFDFIGAYEPALGSFSACSLFSPMHDFLDAAAARATALAVLELLRPAPQPAAPRPAQPARRSFLFGRRGAAGVAV
jgi:[NiFe] hydrogenase assembly HybE family chaperone